MSYVDHATLIKAAYLDAVYAQAKSPKTTLEDVRQLREDGRDYGVEGVDNATRTIWPVTEAARRGRPRPTVSQLNQQNNSRS